LTPKAAKNEHHTSSQFDTKGCPLNDPAIARRCALDLSIYSHSLRAKQIDFRITLVGWRKAQKKAPSRHEATSRTVNRLPMPSSTPNTSRQASNKSANNCFLRYDPTGGIGYTDSTPKAAKHEHHANSHLDTKGCPLNDPATAKSTPMT